jgi:zinc transport system ATP-binding protein
MGIQAAVEIRGATFRYGPEQEPVLEDVSLTIPTDDFLGVIGPNGGGKTTLLKLILGLHQPERGTVRVFGQPPHLVRPRIGYVPQHARIDPTVPADVLDVVLTGRLSRSSWGAWFGRAHVAAAMAALRLTETDDLAQRQIGTLSGGQRQRVLIARALAADAELLLLDEPTAGVDPHMEQSLTDLLHRLNERLPIVLVSHDVGFVSTHLKRVACLNRRATVHEKGEITGELLSQMYRDHVHVHHASGCPLSDPGCEAGCQSHELPADGRAPGRPSGDAP